MLTVGNKIKLSIIDLDYRGYGVAKIDTYVCFVKHGLKDEIVEALVTKVKGNIVEAKAVHWITRSKDRNETNSNLDALDLSHLTPQNQLTWQRKITEDTLKKIGQLDVQVNDTLTDYISEGYRNKSVFFVLKTQPLVLGLYDQDKNLVQVDDFLLSDTITNQILKQINHLKINIANNTLSHVVFRSNLEHEVLLTFVSKSDKVQGLDKLVDVLKYNPNIVGITLNINTNPRHILGNKSIILYGENVIVERLNGVSYPIDDTSFFQINVPVIDIAIKKIKSYLDPYDIVLDAYSGTGFIGYQIYDKVKQVHMVESNKANIEVANRIKTSLHADNVFIHQERAESFKSKIDFNKVIVDPPRNGLMSAFIDHLIDLKPDVIYYLSCDVKTLARDIKLLSDLYNIDSVDPIRMFYHTTATETLVILKKKIS